MILYGSSLCCKLINYKLCLYKYTFVSTILSSTSCRVVRCFKKMEKTKDRIERLRSVTLNSRINIRTASLYI